MTDPNMSNMMEGGFVAILLSIIAIFLVTMAASAVSAYLKYRQDQDDE